MKNKQIEIFDSTLRDGAQGEGISFTVDDKLAIVKLLDEFGIHYIEAGNPASNPKDAELFQKLQSIKLKNSCVVAFGSTRKKGISAETDLGLAALIAANTQTVVIFGKCWDLHVCEILRTTLEENLAMIFDSVSFCADHGKKVIFDAEHFFDGYKKNPQYALDALGAAVSGGATTVVLCDTNGGCLTEEIRGITAVVTKKFPNIKIGIHCHNDGGLAVANSMAAIEVGAAQIQGTMIGFGERTGNANLSTVIANLQLKKGCKCVPCVKPLASVCRKIAEIANLQLDNNMPYVGKYAFSHKAGMHADAVMKNSTSFEHISPEFVGNERRFILSEAAGRNIVFEKLRTYFPEIKKDSPEIKNIIATVKELEHKGYQFDNADASFFLIALKAFGKYSPLFKLNKLQVTSIIQHEGASEAAAAIEIEIAGKSMSATSCGNGPVNALDRVIRQILQDFYPTLKDVSLIDYKVRVLDDHNATASVVRVLITSTDGKKTWTTIGVSQNIIEASYNALVESIEYFMAAN